MIVLLLSVAHAWEPADLRDGDLVFQRSTSAQSVAVAEATGSEYTHVGVVLRRDGKVMVLEAVEPVKLTPIGDWIAHGEGPAVARRLKEPDRVLTAEVIAKMNALADDWLGVHYDARFAWTDDRLYCSELAWKLYDRAAGVRLSEPRPLRSYRLDGQAAQSLARKRYPEGLPLDELVVSPGDLADSPALVAVE
jgi:hypothetical protein